MRYIKRPKVLLCDEPTGALDYEAGKLVQVTNQHIVRMSSQWSS